MTYDGYQELAAAVLKMAIKDYEKAYRRCLRHPESRDAALAVEREKRFFYSDWFEVLADQLDGPRLVRMVEEKVRREMKKDEVCTT